MDFVTRKLSVDHPTHGKIEVETKVKQYSTMAEAVEDAGSEAKLLAFLNTNVVSASASPARAYVKTKEALTKTIDEIKAAITDLRQNFSPATSARIGKETKVSFADAAFAISGDVSLSQEEKAARIMQLLATARS